MTAEIVDRISKIIQEESSKAARNEWLTAQSLESLPIYNYRFDHVKEVVRISRYIANATNADEQIVILAAWLHDIAKPGVADIVNHGIMSSRRARVLLLEEQFDNEIIDRICDVIEKHVGLTLQTRLEPLEAQVLWEADKIVKLGTIGIIHYLLNGIRINPSNDLEAIATQIENFIPLAEKIASSMYTEPGKELAKNRFASLRSFIDNLTSELKLEVSKNG